MNENLNKFYVLVDNEKKIVTNKIQRLPENWCNISGLPGLTDDQLKNLDWAGHKHIGWINIKSQDLKNYSSSSENLELNKNTFKTLVTKIRKENQYGIVEYNGVKIKSNIKTLYSLYLSQTKEKINYKCINGYHTFTQNEIKELYVIIETYIQKWFDWEMYVYKQIDECKNISDFLVIEINKNKPQTNG